MNDPDATDAVSAVAALADPMRRRLYEILEGSAEPLARDELAERTGIARATVAFHLEKLVDVGALTTVFAHRSDRRGPGSGRPAKFYAVAHDELSASVPERRYDLIGDLLATAVDRSDRTGEPVRTCLVEFAEERGRELGDAEAPLVDTLAGLGYEPASDDAGGFVLDNCPFHRLASRHTEVICSANAAFVRGLAESTGEGRDVELEPGAGRCCVHLGAASRVAAD